MFALQANDLASNASVKELKWASDVEGFSPPFDVIIASDLLYDTKSIPELMLTIVSLSSSDTVTYMAFELRPNVIRAAFQAMELYGLKAEQVRAAIAVSVQYVNSAASLFGCFCPVVWENPQWVHQVRLVVLVCSLTILLNVQVLQSHLHPDWQSDDIRIFQGQAACIGNVSTDTQLPQLMITTLHGH